MHACMHSLSHLPRVDSGSLPGKVAKEENMSNHHHHHHHEDELERMLEEAERLAAQIRSAAVASQVQLESSPGCATTPTKSNHHREAKSNNNNTASENVYTSQDSEEDAAADLPRRQPPPPKHPPRQASGSTIDTGVPVSTVQIPHQPPSVDDLSLPSNIHIVSTFDHHHHVVDEGRPLAEVEAAIRATQNMERALQALGATTLEEEEGEQGQDPASPIPDSPPTVSRKSSPATLHREFAEATSAASSSHNNKRKKKQAKDSVVTSSTSSKATAQPAATSTTNNRTIPPPPSSTSSLPKEGDSDYVPLRDYSFKPSKFAPDESVTWEQVDTPGENDDDFVPLKDYSNVTPIQSTNRVAVVAPMGRGGRSGTTTKRYRRRIRAAVAISLTVLGFAYYFMKKAVPPTTTTTTTTTTTMIPEREPVDPPPASLPKPIHIEPLPWIVKDASEDEDMFATEEMDLEEAFSNYVNGPITHDNDGDDGKNEEQHEDGKDPVAEEEEYEFGDYIDIEPARRFLCNLPTGWLVFGDRCHSSSRKERVDSLLNAMLL